MKASDHLKALRYVLPSLEPQSVSTAAATFLKASAATFLKASDHSEALRFVLPSSKVESLSTAAAKTAVL